MPIVAVDHRNTGARDLGDREQACLVLSDLVDLQAPGRSGRWQR
jgi:hypothetical protein